MPTTFRPYTPQQSYLLPPSPKDWLPEGHLANFISDIVDDLDLTSFFGPYEGDGRRNRPFDPRMMIKIIVYGYAVGVRSSRKMAKKLHEDVAFRVLAAENFPAHRTIADFRQQHLKELAGLFIRVVQLAQEMGLLKVGTLAVDGSKVKANASKHKSMSYGRMKQEQQNLEKQIQEILEEAATIDAQEDRLYGEENTGDELPEELQRREDRLAKIKAAKKRLEQRQAEEDASRGRKPGDGRKSPKGGRDFKRDFGVPEDKTQENFTDPDSRIMKGSEGYVQAYNAQIAVEETSQLVVATGLTQNAADNGELLTIIEAAEKTTGQVPPQVLADAGYKGEENFQRLEKKQIDGYISLGREGTQINIIPDKGFPASKRMIEKLCSPSGRQRYKRRKAIVEPVYGWVKEILGFRRFSFRGLEKVRAEWDLVCLALNLKRLHALFAAV
jgi:transposase